MKLRCDKDALSQALAALVRIVPARTTLPILSGCLIFSDGEQLVLQSTDLEVSLTLRIPASVEEEGSAVVMARHLSDLVRRLPAGELELLSDEATQQLKITSSNTSSLLNTWPAGDYPPVQQQPSENSFRIDGARWQRAVRKVLIAAASQEVRPNLAGVYLRLSENSLCLAATDSYRLSVVTFPYQDGLAETHLFIPASSLGEVLRLVREGQDLEIFWDESLVSFQSEQFILTTRLINARFPDFEKVIPKSSLLELRISRESLEHCLDRASLFVAPNEHYAISDLRVEGKRLKVSAEAAQMGSFDEDLALEEDSPGECQASFNTRFLLDPLRVMDQEVITLCLNGTNGPALYREEGEELFLHLVLPVCRVSEV